MIDFAARSLTDARKYRDAYVASLHSRRDWLVAEMIARSADPEVLSHGALGLEPLWAWAKDLIDSEPSTLRLRTSQPANDLQPGPRPPWYDQSTQDPWLSDGLLWLIELLGVHLTSVVLDARPRGSWEVYQSPSESADYFQHRTMLFGAHPRPVDPAAMIHTSVIGHVLRGESWSERPTLSSLYEFIVGE